MQPQSVAGLNRLIIALARPAKPANAALGCRDRIKGSSILRQPTVPLFNATDCVLHQGKVVTRCAPSHGPHCAFVSDGQEVLSTTAAMPPVR